MYNVSQKYKDKVLADSTQHELNIYIDGNKIEPNHIIDFNKTLELFNNSEFCLGCTPEIDIEFEIDKRDLPETYNEVYIESGVDDEIVPIGYFTIQKPIEDNEFKVKIKATDYMKKFEENKYDGSDLAYPQTMLQVLQDICKKIGVELGSTSFLNSDKQIAVYDNTVSARAYLGYIAEQAGGIAVIGRDGKLYIKQIGQDIIELDINLFGDYKWGDKFKVSKVSYEDGVQDYKFGDETADTVYINQNNMYIVDNEQVENIYNQIKDFEIYSFEGETIIDPAYDIGDILVVDGKPVLYQGELNYAGKFKANIKSKIQAKTEQESMQTKENTTIKIKRVESRIDQAEGKITQLTQETTETSEKLTQVEQNVDELSSKVSNIQDLTKTTSGNKTITLANCAEGDLLSLRIKGNNTVFKYLYPEDDLYPTDDLYPMGDSRILVNDTLYELGVTEVLRKNEDIYDEFILENGQAKVIRRINKDGSIKDEEIIEELGELSIPLNEGENTIQIKNYYAKIEAKYAVKSDYTDVFATKVEMNTSIAQTAEDINTEVSKKVDETELGTKITQNYESVQIAWNSISEFIQFLNAMLQILGENKKLLMSLDKTGMHFYNSSGQEIGNVGIYNSEVSFYINGDISGSSMSWGINKTINGEKKYFPVFLYEGYNTESGTEFGGKFLLEAPLIMQENTLFLGQDTNSSYIKSLDSNERKKVTIGNTDDFYIYNSSGDLIFVLNSSYLKLYEQLEMGINLAGTYTFDFKDNIITGVERATINEIISNSATIDDIPNSDNVRRFNNTGTDYLIAVLKSSAGGGSIYCQNASSDKKFKDNIKDTEINALDIVKQIQHRQFDWKASEKHEGIGYIAQELEQISPYLVNKIQEDSEETYLLNEKALIATATKAIQELQEQIEQLKAEIKELKEETNGKN